MSASRLSSTVSAVETVYATHAPSGESWGSVTSRMRSRSFGLHRPLRGQLAGAQQRHSRQRHASVSQAILQKRISQGGRLYGPLYTTPPFITNPTLLEALEVRQRVPGDGDDVGDLPGASEPTRSSQPMSSAADRVADADGLHRRHAVADHVGELAGDEPVGVDPAVGTVRDPDPGGDRLPEPGALGLGGLVVLPQDLLRPALLPCRRWRCSRRCRCRPPARCPSPSSARSPRRRSGSRARWSGRPARTARLMPSAPWAWAAT